MRVITVDFLTANDLFKAYMPFVANGGLFVPTRESFEMGEEVKLDLKLLKDPERVHVEGVVVWLTPTGAQGGKPAGVGVQFEEEKGATVRHRIETHLAGLIQSTNATDTM